MNSEIERKIRGILDQMLEPKSVEAWLVFPHPDLGDRTPQSVINEGKGQAVLDMLENAMAGGLT